MKELGKAQNPPNNSGNTGNALFPPTSKPVW
jgi:hypothetical protein